MKPIKFEDYKSRIEESITNKGFSIFGAKNPQGNYVLLEKFINQPLQDEISGNFIVGGPSIPMVAIIDLKTGEIKFIALKLIIPDFPLN